MSDNRRRGSPPPRSRDTGYPSRGNRDEPSRSSGRPDYHRDRRRSTSPNGPGDRSRPSDNGYRGEGRGGGYGDGDRDGRDQGRSNERYDPRDGGGSAVRGGAGGRGRGSGSYTASDRERERRGDRDRYGAQDENPADEPRKSPPKPNFNPSGLLAQEANTVVVSSAKAAAAGKTGEEATKVILKYHEPPEARKPTRNWRLYVFKGSEELNMIPIHAQSSYLFGRDKLAVEIPIEHPSASKQHAVIQYRQMTEKNEFGDTKTAVKPFMIDLDSTNGTFVNDQEIPPSRYYELRASDVIKFAQSKREYVLLHEESVS